MEDSETVELHLDSKVVANDYRKAVPLEDRRGTLQIRDGPKGTLQIRDGLTGKEMETWMDDALGLKDKKWNSINFIKGVQLYPNDVVKEKALDEWIEGIDRFSNFLITKKCPKKDILSGIVLILTTLKSKTYKSNYGSEDVLIYLEKDNSFICKIKIDDYMTCEFTIALYVYQKGQKDETLMLDIQELCGEHFTFSEFLEHFKQKLEEEEICHSLPTYTQEFMSSFGLDMDICLKILD